MTSYERIFIEDYKGFTIYRITIDGYVNYIVEDENGFERGGRLLDIYSARHWITFLVNERNEL